ncbi:MAG: 4Fe-4S binding protein [Methanomicrobiales archaeon]|nr:4Fe-4S binding protein [Methanomicrobiales archaeon]
MTRSRRFEEARGILERRQFFKLVCGAGNEDPAEVGRLATLYTLAGAAALDLSANPLVVRSAREGIRRAGELAPRLGRAVPRVPFITVSVGLEGDPHIRKAFILEDRCTRCMLCQAACEQEAITGECTVVGIRCIGCGKCAEACQAGAIGFRDTRRDLAQVIPECLREGAEMVELHAVSEDEEQVMADWRVVDSLVPGNYVSMCLDRSLLSNRRIAERIRRLHGITGDRLMIQADGAPMSGGEDDYNTTLQAIATADIVAKTGIPVKILASGGTNSRTRGLADLCGVAIHGVSLGTFARKAVRRWISREDFGEDLAALREAVAVAEDLVRRNTGT